MKRNLLNLFIMLGVIAILTSACAKKPSMEIDAAKAAIEAAKDAEADRYLPAEFNAVQDSLNVAMTLLNEQNSKFSLFRNYSSAKQKLEEVVSMAADVKENTSLRKEEVKVEVQVSMEESLALVEEVKSLIKRAPRGKEGKAAIEAIKDDLAVVENTLAETSTLIENEDFVTAKDKIDAAKQKAEDLKLELEEVIAKVR
jgi:hypothetical protein